MFGKKDKLNQLSDKEIVHRLQGGYEEKLFAVLYDRYVGKVFGKCMSLVNNKEEAEDLTHDVFVKVFANLPQFKHVAAFSTWVYRITYNYCIDILKQKQRKKEVLGDVPELEEQNEEEQEAELMQLRAEALQVALKEIDVEEQVILLLKYQDGHPIKEICDILEIKESAAKMRIKRARSKVLLLCKEQLNQNV